MRCEVGGGIDEEKDAKAEEGCTVQLPHRLCRREQVQADINPEEKLRRRCLSTTSEFFLLRARAPQTKNKNTWVYNNVRCPPSCGPSGPLWKKTKRVMTNFEAKMG